MISSVYEQIMELENAPFSRITNTAFTTGMREIYNLIDPNQISSLGLPNQPINFLKDFDSAITSIEVGFTESDKSIETQAIKDHISVMKPIASGINEGIDATTKIATGDTLVTAQQIYSITKNFVTARQRPDREFVEECNVICETLLEQENAKKITSLSPLILTSVTELKEICDEAIALYSQRTSSQYLKNTDEKRDECIILYNYLKAKVLTQANSNQPNQIAVAFVEEHNKIAKEIKKSYNLKMGQIHKDEDELDIIE